jgi:hypothetical protein
MPLLGSPVSGYYKLSINNDADMDQLMEGMREYSANAARSPGKLACSYAVNGKELYWFECYENMDAVNAHVSNCLPTYKSKIVPNTSMISMVANCDPAELNECKKFMSQWGAKNVVVSAVIKGSVSK